MALLSIDFDKAENSAAEVDQIVKDIDGSMEEMENIIQKAQAKGIQTDWAEDFIKELKAYRAGTVGQALKDMSQQSSNIRTSIKEARMYSVSEK